jgi:hypothetical protein
MHTAEYRPFFELGRAGIKRDEIDEVIGRVVVDRARISL